MRLALAASVVRLLAPVPRRSVSSLPLVRRTPRSAASGPRLPWPARQLKRVVIRPSFKLMSSLRGYFGVPIEMQHGYAATICHLAPTEPNQEHSDKPPKGGRAENDGPVPGRAKPEHYDVPNREDQADSAFDGNGVHADARVDPCLLMVHRRRQVAAAPPKKEHPQR